MNLYDKMKINSQFDVMDTSRHVLFPINTGMDLLTVPARGGSFAGAYWTILSAQHDGSILSSAYYVGLNTCLCKSAKEMNDSPGSYLLIRPLVTADELTRHAHPEADRERVSAKS